MSSKTKIVVLRMKEIIYTAIFIGLAIFLILLFFFMFRSEKEAPAPTAESVSPAVYAPGVYSASLSLGRQNVNVEVAVSPDRISAVTLVPLSDSVAAMYPLMQPSMDALSAQILESQSLEGLEYPPVYLHGSDERHKNRGCKGGPSKGSPIKGLDNSGS